MIEEKEDACLESCSQTIIHREVIEEVKSSIPDDDSLQNVAELFKVLGDRTRTRILHALFASEMCVCDLAYLLGMTQSAISHQLRVLKQAKLVKNRKEGKVVYYSLLDDHVKAIFEQAFAHVKEEN
ncbi:metalloregulator ArsR/SmtB family transcription factor [Ectobacillus antri]|uniref:Metalloregulator ArsR/SmtB family transcription factor n=1 Tax=Ectobacillus antri TaxID=2486280 RepID=A0ABT6H8E5_9BACI|nr:MULTISPECIES: metalloregulator ArsR/SmtB family transcription factor [Ectobacillus]MDG4657729.1 metalloregulator ArsR/SmtB family transcription factor [Ectobacillus antri]MDG5754736.1 metalloregulator ArsR/SmtB family transcription factor [Ectobacillus antri]UOY94614.1 metalloregulator ArsR/SmtB family transcription factor [Ectobacillus sp. JY-23]